MERVIGLAIKRKSSSCVGSVNSPKPDLYSKEIYLHTELRRGLPYEESDVFDV